MDVARRLTDPARCVLLRRSDGRLVGVAFIDTTVRSILMAEFEDDLAGQVMMSSSPLFL